MSQATATFQVIDGKDKGCVFRDMPLPVTFGRDEGNTLRLNDERASRYHAKLELVDGDYILTDLNSTNGTRVNGITVKIRRLRIGDRIGVGRSLVLFGSNEEIAERLSTEKGLDAEQSQVDQKAITKSSGMPVFKKKAPSAESDSVVFDDE